MTPEEDKRDAEILAIHSIKLQKRTAREIIEKLSRTWDERDK